MTVAATNMQGPRRTTTRHWKHRARRLLDGVAAGSGLLGACERRMAAGLTILMYHRVLPAAWCKDYPLPSLPIPDEAFARQVQWLAAQYRVLPVEEAIHELALLGGAGADRSQRPLLSITFDDGYADNFGIAGPILEANGVRATFFVCTDFVGRAAAFWFDRAADAWVRTATAGRERLMCELLAQLPVDVAPGIRSLGGTRAWMNGLKRARPDDRAKMIAAAEQEAAGGFDTAAYAPMTVDQVRALHAAGHEIGSHTLSHPMLPQLSDAELNEELKGSRAVIQEWTGSEVRGFCYPNGDVDARVHEAVHACGYSYACTTAAGRNDTSDRPFLLRRIGVAPRHVLGPAGEHDELAFRSEVCRFRTWYRELVLTSGRSKGGTR